MRNKQEIIERYTKLVMKRLYNEEVLVFFRKGHMCFRGLFRNKELPPYSLQDIKRYQKNPQASITFNSEFYNENEIAPHIWLTIVHEITHYEEDIMLNTERLLVHSDRFKEIEDRNLKLVEDLRMEFNKELGWDKDEFYDDREEVYCEESLE